MEHHAPVLRETEDSNKPWRSINLSLPDRTILFFKFGRYAWIILLVAASLAIFPLLSGSMPIWAKVLFWLVSAGLLAWSFSILAQWPRKLSITKRHLWSIAENRFDPENLLSLCGDPCYRLVAREILSRAQLPDQATQIVRDLAKRAGLFSLGSVRVDKNRNVIVFIDDNQLR